MYHERYIVIASMLKMLCPERLYINVPTLKCTFIHVPKWRGFNSNIRSRKRGNCL